MSAPILWINGPFGVSRVQIAKLLQQRLEKSFIFDPAEMSRVLCKLTPTEYQEEQNHPLWIPLMLDALQYCAKEASGTVLVPVAVRDLRRHCRLMDGLNDRGLTVHHFTLMASPKMIYAQSRRHGDLSLSEITLSTRLLESEQFATHLDIENNSYDDLLELIAGQANLKLSEPKNQTPLHWIKNVLGSQRQSVGFR